MNSFEISNVSVAGETLILTKNGYFPIVDLQNKVVEIWDGNKWREVKVKEKARRRHLITVFLSNGRSLTCSPEHTFIINRIDVSSNNAEEIKIPAQFIIQGMNLRKETLPVVEGKEPFLHPYLHGAMCSFGCFTKQGPIIDITGPVLSSIINHPDMIVTDTGEKVFPDDLPGPYLVPINSPIKVKLEWLAGFFDARSFISKLGLIIININEKLLQDTQLLLTTLGASSFIGSKDNVNVPLPERKSVSVCNYTLLLPWEEYGKLHKLGLTGVSHMGVPDLPNNIPLMIVEVVDIGRISPTYCFS